MSDARELLLYGTLGCHLCEVAEQLLLPWVEQGWQVELVDIAEEDALLDRYALLIPVLLHSSSQQQLLWPFGAETLHQFLQAVQA